MKKLILFALLVVIHASTTLAQVEKPLPPPPPQCSLTVKAPHRSIWRRIGRVVRWPVVEGLKMMARDGQ